MDKNAIANELADLGQSDARLLDRLKAVSKALEANRARRCELLSAIACDVETDLDAATTAKASEPKDGGGK